MGDTCNNVNNKKKSWNLCQVENWLGCFLLFNFENNSDWLCLILNIYLEPKAKCYRKCFKGSQ